ncbi:hypothetical protein DPMN_086447 [Dreissena polymorpha]|uniref:Uncharacterized protein n=1 Tax=Dreissena polymorpha TaxID=45954 RepID=A0A9D4KQH3_DREPO|nr:hypothetical protein DPMN_086447 [Dreissena polymorpha]
MTKRSPGECLAIPGLCLHSPGLHLGTTCDNRGVACSASGVCMGPGGATVSSGLFPVPSRLFPVPRRSMPVLHGNYRFIPQVLNILILIRWSVEPQLSPVHPCRPRFIPDHAPGLLRHHSESGP